MKRTTTVAVLVLLLPILAWGQAPQTPVANADEAQLRHIKTVLWPRAYREQDVGLLDQLLHPNFRRIDAEGNVSSKQDEMEYIKTHKPSYLSFRFEIERLEVFAGKFAVVSGLGIILSQGKAGKEETRYRSSNHLIKENGNWRAVSSHVSGVRTTRLEN